MVGISWAEPHPKGGGNTHAPHVSLAGSRDSAHRDPGHEPRSAPHHLTSAAHAASSTTITGEDGVRYDSCRDYPYSYTIDTSWAVYWDADVTLFDPERSYSNSDFLYDGSDPASGRSTFFICTCELAGKYKVTIKATLYDSSYDELGKQSDSDTFVLRKPRTKTSYTVGDTTPGRGHLVRVRITSKIERPAGYAPNRYEYMALEGRRTGKWQRVKAPRPSPRTTGSHPSAYARPAAARFRSGR